MVEPTHLKNMSQNGFIFPNFRVENEKYVRNHHPVMFASTLSYTPIGTPENRSRRLCIPGNLHWISVNFVSHRGCTGCTEESCSKCEVHVDVSENRGIPKSSILIGFSIINHPFWGTLIFGNTHVWQILSCGQCWQWIKKSLKRSREQLNQQLLEK